MMTKSATLCAGIAEEMRADGIASNTRCGRTMVVRAAYRTCWAATGDGAVPGQRVCADAGAYVIVNRPATECTGKERCCARTCSSNPASPTSVYDCVSATGVVAAVEDQPAAGVPPG